MVDSENQVAIEGGFFTILELQPGRRYSIELKPVDQHGSDIVGATVIRFNVSL